MNAQGSQQVVRADHGSVIENVTQIIQGGKPDVAFSRHSARRVSNRIHRGILVDAVRNALGEYFWRPSNIVEALVNIEVRRWRAPLWRLHGEVSASWTRMIQEVVGKTEDVEITQWVPKEDSATYSVDWLVPAHRPTSRAQKELSEAIHALNRSELPVRVDWHGYPFGEPLERLWSNLKAGLGDLPKRRRSPVAHAATLFEDPLSASHESREMTGEHVRLPELEPELSLLNAIERADRQIEDCLRSRVSRSSKRLKEFRIRLDVDNVEQYWFPIWVAQYTYRGTQRFAVVNGHSSGLINARLPLPSRARLIAWGVPTLLLGIPFWLLGACLLYQALSFPLGGVISFLIPLLFALIPFVMTGFLVAVWWIRNRWSP